MQAGPVGPVRGAVALGVHMADGSCMAKGFLFGLTGVFAGNAILYRWKNPTAISVYDTVFLDFNNNMSDLVYDAANDALYAGVDIANTPPEATIFSVDPDTMVVTTLVNASRVGSGTAIVGINSGICTDGTYIYALIETINENSWVYKYQCSDGTQVGALQLGNPTGGTDSGIGTDILTDGTWLYIAGNGIANALSWCGRIKNDLTSPTLITLPSVNTVDDESVLIGTDVWYADETTTYGSGHLAQVAQDMSSVTYWDMNLSPSTGVDGMDYDATTGWLWTSTISSTPGTGGFTAFDVASKTVAKRIALYPGETNVNEVYKLPTGIVAITYESNSRILYVPTTPDVQITPDQPFGRGAGA